jgi:hypothetical protein
MEENGCCCLNSGRHDCKTFWSIIGIDRPQNSLLSRRAELQELAHWIRWASAAYLENTKACAEELKVG